jgi:hypothetical protein
MAAALDTAAAVLDPAALATAPRLLDPAGAAGAEAIADRATGDAGGPNAELVAAVADQLLAVQRIASGDDADAELRSVLLDALHRADRVSPPGQATASPVAGSTMAGALGRLLRAATSSTATGPLTAAEVPALAAAVPAVLGGLTAGPFPAGLLAELAADPDLLPPPGAAPPDELLAEDEADALLFDTNDDYPDESEPPQLRAARPFSSIVRMLSRDMFGLLKSMRTATRSLVSTTHTSDEGDLAHRVIQAHYLFAHRGQAVLVDDNVRRGRTALGKLGDQTSPAWSKVRSGLTVANFVGQPDILNLDTREVYEIKPLSQLMVGAVQLWARYLLPLNAAEAVAAGLPRTAAWAFLRSIGHDGKPTVQPGWPDFWLPGTGWQPSPVYLLPTGDLVFAAQVAPGLIVYEYARTQEQKQEALARNPKKAQKFEQYYLVAALLVGCGLRAARRASGGPPAGLGEAIALAATLGALTQDLTLPDDPVGFAEMLTNAIRAVADALVEIATAVAFLLVAAALVVAAAVLIDALCAVLSVAAIVAAIEGAVLLGGRHAIP